MKPKTIACELPELAADETRQRIQVFPGVGSYLHPKGEFTLTEDTLSEFAADLNTRGADIPVDRDHAFYKGMSAPAAGWFIPGSAQSSAEGVTAEVEWTPKAADEVRNREYRFISPEFAFEAKDGTGRVVPEPTVAAVTITNRPFFKSMKPIAAEDLPLESALVVAEAFGEDVADSLTEISAEGAQALIAAAASKSPYGNVAYADPGYRKDGKKRYPIDTEEHARAAWSYINQKRNAAAYTAEQLSRMKARIKRAAKKFGVTIGADSTAGGDMDLTALAESLGLAADASEEDVLEAAGKVAAENADLKAKLEKAPDDEKVKTLVAEAVKEATEELRTAKRDETIKAAISDMKIVAAERETYEGFWKIDPAGTEKLLAAMTPRLPSRPHGSESSFVPVQGPDGKPVARLSGEGTLTADLEPVVVDGIAIPVDEDRARVHAATMDMLEKRGVTADDEHFEEKYIAAASEAANLVGVEL